MGSGISDNYTNITPTFTSRYWKVHSAIKKSTGEEVSLWLLDSKEIKQASRSKDGYQKYLDSCIESVNKLRRLHHPNILQIYEVSDNPKQFGFSSERVEGTLESDKTINADDITYVADQLSQALSFLHDSCKLLHLGICPDAVCITKAIKVKICALNYSTSIETEKEVNPSYGNYVEGDPLNPEICYTAPEYLEKKPVTAAADVFSYAATLFAAYNQKGPLYMATTTEEVIVTVSATAFKTPTNMNDPMHDLLLKCLNYNPEERPTLADIIKSPAFFQLSIRSLRFLGLLATKDTDDKMHFFQNIIKSLALFSDRLLYYNVLPTFVNEVRNNDIYGPALIPVIFHIGSKISSESFIEDIIKPLNDVLQRTSPPALVISVLNVVNVIIQKVPEDMQFQLFYPIFINALQSSFHEVRMEAIKNIPIVISSMNEHSILNSLLPTLLNFVSSFDDVDIVCSVIQCIGKCSAKVNGDQFSLIIMPKLMICWVRLSQPKVALSIIDVLESIQSSIASKMKFVIPIASAILSTPHLPKEISAKIGQIISSTIETLRAERKLEERSESWRPSQKGGNDEVQIQAPIKVDQIDQEKIETSRRRSSVISDSPSGPSSFLQPSPIGAAVVPQQSLYAQQQQPQNQQQQMPPSNQQSFGSVSNSNEPEVPEKKSIKSFFGFGKKKKEEPIEEQSVYDGPTVAPRGGPPGPPTQLPNTQPAYSAPQVAPRGGPPGPLPVLHHQQPQQQPQSLYAQQQPQSLYAQQQNLHPQQPQSLYAQHQTQQPPQQSLYAQHQQPQQQPQSLYAQHQTQQQPQQSLYAQHQQPQQQQPQSLYAQHQTQPQPQQAPSLFAGMNQGPPPKKPSSSNSQSLFSGLNMRNKK